MQLPGSLRLGTLAMTAALLIAPAALGQMTPVAATGWNRDIIVDKNATTPFSGFAQSFDVPNNWALYQTGVAGSTKGLAVSGTYTSIVDPTTTIQLQPSNASNALFMTTTAAATLTLAPAAQRPYDRLALFSSSTNAAANSTGNVVINFTDGTSSSAIPYNAFDWFFVTTNNAINNIGRVRLTDNSFDAAATAVEPRIYQTTLDLTSTGLNLNTRSIQSLTFTKPANANATAVFAVSGAINTTIAVCCSDAGGCTTSAAGSCVGSFHPEWTTCAQASCPLAGACCFADGHCTVVQAVACTVAGANPQAASSACLTGTCPQPGACCFPDSHCETLQAGACAAASGGVFQAPGVTCATTCPPVPAACCLSDGSCLVVIQATCTGYTGTWHVAAACAAANCTPPNLLLNPGAETNDMSGWTVDANGGNGWSTNFDGDVHSGTHSFSTSSAFGTRHQTIDLLAAGFTADFLDTAPAIGFAEWVHTRFDQGGQYFVRFELLDASSTVITFFEHGTQAAPNVLPANTAWFQEAQTFTGYGPGVRFLNFIDGGRDVNGWAGDYGAHFDDALAGVVVPAACCLPGGNCQIMDMASCITGTGTIQPSGTTCDTNPCGGGAATGACCGVTGTCSVLSGAGCASASGSYQGDGSVCSTNPCPQTACCNAATGACQLTTNGVCPGGTSQAATLTSTCGAGVCPQVACCNNGSCSISVLGVCPAGTPFSPAQATCGTNPCPQSTGACCNGAGGCSLQTAANCTTPAGAFQGSGSACIATNCGVCCRGSTCVTSVFTAAACASSLPSGAAAGSSYVANTACGGTNHKIPCCYADYNKVGGKTVSDIFAYLSDWFAHSPYAFNGTPQAGNAPVSQIFAFLGDWFAGCN